VAGWLQRYGLNLRSLGYSGAGQREALLRNAQAVLGKLHALLLQPLEAALRPFSNLIIVPHGPLHYLPFHALYDGRTYLAERHTLSYLPAASFLRYMSGERRPLPGGAFFAGHSWGGRLPYTVTEAQTLGRLWGVAAVVEDEVTLERVRGTASESSLVHLATHGDFRPDNPLFSGLSLADGWLTTLDVFDLRLQASLVTLSACQTGRNVVAGGDELFGLMRAFLQAGARSLLLSLWPVADETTAGLMTAFYQKLAAGRCKGEALREAQRSFVEGDPAYRHPYFWAPFYLVGDAGPL
jgi:CHAT domain-containing protein